MIYQPPTKLEKINRLPFFTYGFLGIQIIVYVLMELKGVRLGIINGSENSAILYLFGAMSPAAIAQEHDYWRLVTPIFIHIGFMHLALNSFSLYFVGRLLEPIIGNTRFFVLYMLSGILGNLFSFALGNPYGLSAGASTSLFGIFAAFVVLGKIFPYQPLIRQMSRNMGLLIMLNLVMNLFDSGVDILGHFGGAVGGVLLMLVLGVPKARNRGEVDINGHKRIVSGIMFVFLCVVCYYYGMTVKF